jgi:hypothetical protein
LSAGTCDAAAAGEVGHHHACSQVAVRDAHSRGLWNMARELTR